MHRFAFSRGWHPVWLVAAQATCLIATALWWHLRMHTNLAGQYHPRTVIALEGFPLIAISIAILTIHIPASWMVATSPRRLDVQAMARALVAVMPCILLPVFVGLVLRSLPPKMIPGIDSLELVEFVPVQLQLPWAFFLSLMPLLMLGAGFGLLLEATAGRGIGALGPLVTYGLVVVVQSYGHLDFLAGFPGKDISLTWQGFALGVLALAAGVAAYGLTRGGAQRLTGGIR